MKEAKPNRVGVETEEELRHLQVAVDTGVVQRRVVVEAGGVDIGAIFEQKFAWG